VDGDHCKFLAKKGQNNEASGRFFRAEKSISERFCLKKPKVWKFLGTSGSENVGDIHKEEGLNRE
jgi:hypothetical protein